jgi:hypothetical protein
LGALEDARKQAEELVQQTMKQAQAQGGGFANANIAAAQAESAAAKQDAAGMDTSGPEFQPVEGVTYEQYVALCVKMQPAGTDTAKQTEIAVANGLTEEQWKKVGDAFTKRCIDNPKFARRLGMDVMAGDKG